MNHTYMSVLPNTLQAGHPYPCMCHWPLPNSDYNITNDPRQRLMPTDRQHYQYSSPGTQILKNWNMRFTIKKLMYRFHSDNFPWSGFLKPDGIFVERFHIKKMFTQ